MTNGKLIVITGPAAAGKSTVARGLQAELVQYGDLWLVIELDIFARSLSRDWTDTATEAAGAIVQRIALTQRS